MVQRNKPGCGISPVSRMPAARLVSLHHSLLLLTRMTRAIRRMRRPRLLPLRLPVVALQLPRQIAGLAFLQSLTGVVPRTGDELLLFQKIDWIVNSKNHLSMEYNRMRWASPAGIQTAGVVFRGQESFGNDFVKDDTVIARLVSTVTPTMINEFRFQYGRDFEFQKTQPAFPGEPVSSQGISPQITISGSAGIVFGKPNFLDRRSYPDERSLQFADTYSVSRGKHMFKFGGDVVRRSEERRVGK